MRRALALAALVLLLVPAAAQADIKLRSQQGSTDFDPPVVGQPSTLVITTPNSAVLQIEHSAHAYTLNAVSGGPFASEQGFGFPDDIEFTCTGVGTNSVTCPDTEVPASGEVPEPPYGLHVFMGGSSSVSLTGPGNVEQDQAYPGSITIDASNSLGGGTVNNASGANVTFNGHAGDDTYHMGAGDDTVHGGGGTDTVLYDRTFTVGAQNPHRVRSCPWTTWRMTRCTPGCTGSAVGPVVDVDNVGSDVENVTGGPEADRITGTAAANVLHGGAGTDTLNGLGGADQLFADSGGDVMDGGPGPDDFFGDPAGGGTVTYAGRGGAVTADFNGLRDDGEGCPASCENDKIDTNVLGLIGGNGDDSFTGSAATGRTMIGRRGADVLTSSSAGDTLEGDSGADTLMGPAAATPSSPARGPTPTPTAAAATTGSTTPTTPVGCPCRSTEWPTTASRALTSRCRRASSGSSAARVQTTSPVTARRTS